MPTKERCDVRCDVRWFVEPRELYTGEESSLDGLIGDRVGNDVQEVILSFLGEDPPRMCTETKYVPCWDSLRNESVFPVDPDEQKYFLDEYDDDFVIV